MSFSDDSTDSSCSSVSVVKEHKHKKSHKSCKDETVCFTVKHGECGERGPRGLKGERGEKGKSGCDGKSTCGERGHKGDTGERGPRGEKGNKGDCGPKSCDGKNGCDGKCLPNNIIFAGCVIFVLEGHKLVKVDRDSSTVIVVIKLDHSFDYSGITFDGVDLWMSAKKHDKVYVSKYDTRKGKLHDPVELKF